MVNVNYDTRKKIKYTLINIQYTSYSNTFLGTFPLKFFLFRSPSSDRGGRDRRKKRDWSNSPIHKSRKHRSRSRERLSESRSKHEYRSDRSGYSDKYRKGTGMDGGYYRR